MANRYTKRAAKQIGNVYDQQIKSAQSQIPAIQKLYSTLTEGLQSATSRQIEVGSQNIAEDAAARGVSRSTLPVDARQGLETQLGEALAQGLAQYGQQQAQAVGDVQSRIGDLRIGKTTSITDLANTLRDQAFREKELKAQQRMQELQLEQQRAQLAAARSRASSSARASAPTATYVKNKSGGFEIMNASGGKADMDLWQYVQANQGGVSDLVSFLSEGDPQDRKAAQNYLANIQAGVAPTKAFNQLQKDRPTAFYKSR